MFFISYIVSSLCLVPFISVWIIISCRACLITMDSFSFYLPGNVFFFLSHFWGVILLDVDFLVDSFFFQHFRSHLSASSLTVSNNELGVNSLLAACKILSLSLDNLTGPCFSVYFFEFILLGDHWASWTCRFACFLKFGEFLAIISSNNFLCSFLFFLPGTPVKCMLVHLMLSHRSLEFSSFIFILFSHLLFKLESFNWLIFTFTKSSASSNMLLSPFSEIFISVFMHFNSRNSFWCFLKNVIYVSILLFYFTRLKLCSWFPWTTWVH